MALLIDTRTEKAREESKPDAAEFQAALQKAFEERREEKSE